MAERVSDMDLFGGADRSLNAQALEGEAFDQPVYPVSAKSARLGGLAPHLRELASPWFAGAMATSERYGSMVQVARVSVLAVLTALLLLVVLAGALVWLSVTYADVRVVPYIVQTDSHGYVVPIGPAERAAPIDARLQMSAVAQWVLALRGVVGDASAQRTLIKTAFFFVAPDSPATRKVQEWYVRESPMGPHARSVAVEIMRVAPLESGHDFSVEWTEESPRTENEPAVKHVFSAVVSVVLSPTQKLQDIIRNPAGVYVRDFTISRLQ